MGPVAGKLPGLVVGGLPGDEGEFVRCGVGGALCRVSRYIAELVAHHNIRRLVRETERCPMMAFQDKITPATGA